MDVASATPEAMHTKPIHPTSAPARNFELKARVASLAETRARAAALATEHPGIQLQTDTYFHCRQGRLKLREIEGRRAELIWYARDDQADAKQSDYRLVPVADPAALREALAAAWGVRVVVRKRREIFLHHNVRIHLDDVQGLGTFCELEAVVGGPVDDLRARAQVAELSALLGLAATDLLEGSYADLLGESSASG
jgi:predicted adenylyl cyclase CyaB